jgi:undecaprenyl-diphosphatase
MSRLFARSDADAVAEPLAPIVEPGALRRWTRGDTARVAVAAGVLVVTGALARTGLSTTERTAFEWLNQGPDAAYRPLWLVMQLGNVWVATTVAVLVGLGLRRWRVALVLAIAPLLAWEVAKLVKFVVQRGRPETLIASVQLRGPDELGFGFISGHAAVAFALAGAVAALVQRRWTIALFVAASLVAIARVYVGVHLPLDVIGGAATGLLIGEGVRAFEVVGARRGWFRPVR